MTRQQKYAIASMLSTNNLTATIATMRRTDRDNTSDTKITFAIRIDPFYAKRDGFIPASVIGLINAN